MCLVLMLTAREDPKDCIRAFTEGCECYVPKPIQEKALMVELQRLLPSLIDHDVDRHTTQDSSSSSSEERIRCLVVDDDRVCRELLARHARPSRRLRLRL